MAFSGGTFSRTFDCTTDRDNGVKILASKFDTELDGMATGLSTTILKDGTQTCTAAIPFAQGITLPDDKTIAFGTNSDVLIQYDETTTDSLKISAAEGAGLAITLMADEGDDAGDEWKLNIADGGTLTLGNDINSAGTYVTHLTITPNATVANSTMAVAGNLTVGGALTLGSGAVISEAELETIDGITPGTVLASKAMIVDANKDITGGRNLTITGELDAATLDISGNADIDGTLEADAMTLNGTAITATATLDTGISNNNVPKFTSGAADNDFLRIDGTAIEGRSAAEVLSDIAAAPAAGSSNILTTGALNSGSITSGFGSIDNGSSAITTTGTVTAGELTVNTSDQVLINHSGDGGGIRIDSTNGTNTGSLRFGDNADNYIGAVEYNHSTDALSFYANNNTRMTISSSGSVGIGVVPETTYVQKTTLRLSSTASLIAGTSYYPYPYYIANNLNYDASDNLKYIASSGGALLSVNAHTGGSFLFYTAPAGTAGATATLTERVKIDSSGNIFCATTGTTPVQSNTAGAFCYRPTAALEINGNNTQAALFGRTTDGEVLGFYSAGGKEGSISISGTTVSYNGGHLARWSQATDGNRIDGLVKGTVMTNLDQMAKWHHEAKAATLYEDDDEIPEDKKVGDEKTPAVDAYDEDNEQLNCLAVSSVEGDANVAGVFVSWDDDDTDHTADMNIAMTGDMVIRIAKGTTVARGDLLMSAGDGTAKPQDDDIVRSKTIAKVTSTHVSHTYDDGSYIVPCVLMAC